MKTSVAIVKIFFVGWLIIVIQGCSHTNLLSEYKIGGSTILFKKELSREMSGVNAHIGSGYPFPPELLSIILDRMGSSYAEMQLGEKLNKATNPDSLINNISDALQDKLVTCCTISPVDSLSEHPDYIFETKLERFMLETNPYGVYARIKSSARLSSRYTGRTVWENTEISTLPVYDVIIGSALPGEIRTTTSIINYFRLLNMSEEELRYAINSAAAEAGNKLSESLRKDLAGE